MLKIRHFEFWNTHLFHLPIYFYWLYLSCKARSLFFFSAANPGIETGGLMGESKYKILQKIDSRFLPKTFFYNRTPTIKSVLEDIEEQQIGFPFVVKPDIGQGGWLIDLIHDEEELMTFLSKIKMPFMVQEYVDYPLELGLLYYRFPDRAKGIISSIAIKELLTVVGDGVSTVKSLAENHPRGKGQLARLRRNKRIELNRVPETGEKVSLSFIGNHSYGARFLNGNHLISDKLTALFDDLCKNIPGFYFGRFDLRCQSLEDLLAGNFKVLELNGVGSEPLHIFDPREKLFNAWSSACAHWKVIYEISAMNRKARVSYMKFKEAWEAYRNVVRIQRIHNTNFTIGN